MSNIFVSTGAFKTKNISELLKIAEENEIYNIELSSGLDYDKNTEEIIKKSTKSFKFLIHNYFPASKKSFALNLASDDEDVIESSMALCKNAINMISDFGGEFYSLHCGFTFDSTGKELGNSKQLELSRISFDKAYNNFVKNIKELCIYSEKKNVKLAIENNVLAAFAYIDGYNDMYLGTNIEELNNIIKSVNHNNLYLLLDLAHAKVSSTFLKFSIDELINKFKNIIIAVHISDNDGQNDQNLKISYKSELVKYIKILKDKTLVIETYNLEPNEIKEQITILEDIKNDR